MTTTSTRFGMMVDFPRHSYKNNSDAPPRLKRNPAAYQALRCPNGRLIEIAKAEMNFIRALKRLGYEEVTEK